MKIKLLQLFALILFSCDPEIQPISDRCSLEPQSGPCKAALLRYYYDKADGKCKTFTWGGCGGVVPFETLEECQQCEKIK